jgi:SPX domain protein involved in polyphosphate accumulation
MKFGANLQRNIYPPWEQEYIHYDKLKYYLKERQLSLTGWTKTDERYFAENLVATELDKVYQFIDLKLKNTESRIKEMRQLEFSNNFDTESQHINLLLDFIEINNLGFQKIVKKHNKWTFSDLNQVIKICSYPKRFKIFKTRAEQLLYNINEIGFQKNKKINIIRETKKRESSAIDTKTIVTSFWVHPDNLSQVQAIVLFNLPNINSNDSKQPFNSMILENTINFTMYSDLIERKRKAELIQIEW